MILPHGLSDGKRILPLGQEKERLIKKIFRRIRFENLGGVC